jgi:transposase-like protein
MSRPLIPLPKDFADHLNFTVRELAKHYSFGGNTVNRWRREYSTFATLPPRKCHNRPHTDEAKRKMSVAVRAAWVKRQKQEREKSSIMADTATATSSGQGNFQQYFGGRQQLTA